MVKIYDNVAIKAKELNMKKILISAVTFAVSALTLTACSTKQSANQTSSSTKVSTSTTSKSNSTSKTTVSSKPVEELNQNLVTTWQGQNNASISFAADGSYTLSTNTKKVAGLYKIAGKYEETLVLKMSNFDSKTPGLDSYVTISFNPDSSIELGSLGHFTALSTPAQVPTNLLLPNYLKEKPESPRDLIVGTWSNQNTKEHVFITTNYNQDGTYERYSDASGFVSRGRYSLTNKGEKIELSFVSEEKDPSTQTFTVNPEFTTLTENEPGIVHVYSKSNLPRS